MVQDYLESCLRSLWLYARIRDFLLEVLLQLFVVAGAGFIPLLRDDELMLGEGNS